MPGGLLNLVSEGQQNIVLNGNPSKTFFKSTYLKYTNFGMQKFRVDYEGAKTIRLNEASSFNFKIPRYADLLMDCYLSFNLPNIWSPILPPQYENNNIPIDEETINEEWSPYEFKWIENIGAQMIQKISITCGNQLLQEYSGAYLLAMVQRDFSSEKKELFNKMIGNVSEYNDPANFGNNNGYYPNAFYNTETSEPSIRGTTLYVPLNSWFNLKSQMAFPLVSLQYNELVITITIRPLNELFKIRDVQNIQNGYPYIAPNFNSPYYQFYKFVQVPPSVSLDISSYQDKRMLWNTDIHLNCTYCFLSNDESKIFSANEQKYLIRQVHETNFYNVTGSNKIQLDSVGLIKNWMFYMQRSDVNLRNEWSNYTNWEYDYPPVNIIDAPDTGGIETPSSGNVGPGKNADGSDSNLKITTKYSTENNKNILVEMGILLDGQYRENVQPVGVYNLIEKYIRTISNGPDGLYCYNFCMNTSPFEMQPSGALNSSRFNLIEFEISTIVPPLDENAQTFQICDPTTGTLIGINKPTWRIYKYNYNFVLFEERINIVTFIGGNAGLMYAT